MASTILDVRRFLIQKILEANPSAEVRSGSGYGTIVIKPMSILLAPFSNELEAFRARLSLADVATLGSEATDDLIENLFIDRRVGNLASGSVRVYFASPQEKTIPIGTGFVSESGNLYLASETITVTAGAMSINRDGTDYYVDVPIVAADFGTEYNTDENTITSTETDILGAIRVTNPSEVKDGLSTETDQEFVDRAGNAITVRNLVNRRSVQTVLLNEFNFIKSIQEIGKADPEMLRDLIEIITSLGPEEIHIGGHADLYIEPAINESVSVDIPSSSMVGELVISTNVDRGKVTESVKNGLFIDVQPGFFNDFEVEEQLGLAVDPSSTYTSTWTPQEP